MNWKFNQVENLQFLIFDIFSEIFNMQDHENFMYKSLSLLDFKDSTSLSAEITYWLLQYAPIAGQFPLVV